MSDLALPDPQAVTVTQVPALVEQLGEIRREMRRTKDERITEVYDRLGAVRQYIRDREAKQALEAEERRVEVVIGEMLGPADNSRDQTFHAVKSFHPALIGDFRRMFKHEELVERALTADPPVVRRATERRFVRSLYYLRGLKVQERVLDNLRDELPREVLAAA